MLMCSLIASAVVAGQGKEKITYATQTINTDLVCGAFEFRVDLSRENKSLDIVVSS